MLFNRWILDWTEVLFTPEHDKRSFSNRLFASFAIIFLFFFSIVCLTYILILFLFLHFLCCFFFFLPLLITKERKKRFSNAVSHSWMKLNGCQEEEHEKESKRGEESEEEKKGAKGRERGKRREEEKQKPNSGNEVGVSIRLNVYYALYPTVFRE